MEPTTDLTLVTERDKYVARDWKYRKHCWNIYGFMRPYYEQPPNDQDRLYWRAATAERDKQLFDGIAAGDIGVMYNYLRYSDIDDIAADYYPQHPSHGFVKLAISLILATCKTQGHYNSRYNLLTLLLIDDSRVDLAANDGEILRSAMQQPNEITGLLLRNSRAEEWLAQHLELVKRAELQPYISVRLYDLVQQQASK